MTPAKNTPLQILAPPPPETAPSPPPGFDPTARLGRGKSPWTTLVALAPEIAHELASSPTFAEDFGAKQSPGALADLLTTAAAWRAQRNAAEAWAKYVKCEDAAAWQATQRQLVRFRKAFEYAVACDPTLAARYPQMAETLRARSAQSSRGAKTRAAKAAKDVSGPSRPPAP